MGTKHDTHPRRRWPRSMMELGSFPYSERRWPGQRFPLAGSFRWVLQNGEEEQDEREFSSRFIGRSLDAGGVVPQPSAGHQYDLLCDERGHRGPVETSAASLAPTSIASSLRRPLVQVQRPGAPISRPRLRTAPRRPMPATASAKGHGETPRAW